MARRHNRAAVPEDSPHERVKRHLLQRMYVRFHMFLILATAGLSAMLASWLLLKLGMELMWIRFTLAILCAYGVFLLCVGLWLRYVARVRRQPASSSRLDGGDASDALDLIEVAAEIPMPSSGTGGAVSGGGGQFGGGGAGGSWVQPVPRQGFVTQQGGGTSSSGKSFDFDFDLDGDGLVLLVLAIAVIAAVIFSSGYLLWFAPEILAEAVVGAALAGGLARSAGREDAAGWVMGVFRKTWWPFAVVLVLSAGFAAYAQSAYPGVRTAKEALQRALAEDAKPAPTATPTDSSTGQR